MKKKIKKRPSIIKPRWKNVYDPEYREYFVTQAQLSKSIRKDSVVHLTLYEEYIVPLQGKTKKPVVERKIKTTLVIPEKALGRITKFLNKIVEEDSKTKTSEETALKEDVMREDVVSERETKTSKAETSYIR